MKDYGRKHGLTYIQALSKLKGQSPPVDTDEDFDDYEDLDDDFEGDLDDEDEDEVHDLKRGQGRLMKLVVANNKGGVGKSTTAINLSMGLSMEGYRVLMMDMDIQGNATRGIGLDPYNQKYTVLDLLLGDCDFGDVVQKKQGVDVVGNNLFQRSKVHELQGRMGGIEGLISEVVTGHKYDFIIIDTPPDSDNVLLRIAVSGSDAVIVPLEAEPFALGGMDFFIENIRKARKSVLGILYTKTSPRYNLTKVIVNSAEKRFGSSMFKTKIPRSVEVPGCQLIGKPIILKSGHPVAKGYRAFVKEVIQRAADQR